MATLTERLFHLIAAVLLVLVVAGCATTADRKVTLLYEPTVHAAGGSGELYLAKEAEPAPSGANQAVQWVIGSIKDRDGNKTGSIVTDTMPVDLVLQAFSAELKAAGYTVVPVSEVPPKAVKGISLGNVVITLDEVASLVKAEAKSSIKVSAEIWRDGNRVTRLTYETVNSDMTVTGRDQFLRETLGKALQNLMREAVPALIKVLEQK